MIDNKTALKIIADNEYTILVVNINGEIQKLIPLASAPTQELIMGLGQDNKGSAFQILQKSNLAESQLLKEVNSLVEALKWAKTHKLKPGANFPRERKRDGSFKR